MFKKLVDSLIEKEFQKRKKELEDKLFAEKLALENKLNSEIAVFKKNFEYNLTSLKSDAEQTLTREKTELEVNHIKTLKNIAENNAKEINESKAFFNSEKIKLETQHQETANELLTLINRVNLEIKECKQVRLLAQEEQKQLWEKLDILKNNLNTQDIFVKLYECAYSKAVDVVWDIQKKETLRLIEIAKEEGIEKGIEDTKKIYEQKILEMIKNSSDVVNIPLLMKKKNDTKELYLRYQRIKDKDKEEYYKGQVDLIAEILNGKH